MQTWPDVLIVDDERNIRFFTAEIFRLEGIAAAAVSDGCQAIDYFENIVAKGGQMPRVVVLDVMMPCMNGLEVYDAIAEKPWSKEMKIILTSGSREEPGYTGKHRDLYILTKPYEVLALVDMVREVAPELFEKPTGGSTSPL